MLMSEKRTCKAICKKFKASKPTGSGRYESGQARCQICDIWIDYKGCHNKDGLPATKDSTGWYCNCCNYRVRQHPRNKKYKEKFRIGQDLNISEHTDLIQHNAAKKAWETRRREAVIKYPDLAISSKVQNITEDTNHENTVEPVSNALDIDRLNTLIDKTLRLIKSSSSGAYISDLRMLLEISQDEMSSVATRVLRIDGISKKEILYEGTLQNVLLTYNKIEDEKDEQELELSENSMQDKEPIGHNVDESYAPVEDPENNSSNKIQELYDQLWYSYGTSDLSRSLYVKYQQQVTDFDSNITIIFQKKYIVFRIHGRYIVGIILQKSKILFDFKLRVIDLDDPRDLLRDISQIGSWTGGKSRIGVSDEDTLEYCIEITRQCYNQITGKHLEILSPTSKNAANSDDTLQIFSETTDEIRLLAEQMTNEYNTNKRMMDKSLQRNLTNEYLKSKSMKRVVENHPELSKTEIMRHIRSPLRLPKRLRDLNQEGLHPDPEYSLHIALFAVNYHEWDGQEDMEESVIHMAESLSKQVIINQSQNDIGYKNKKNIIGDVGLSTAIAVWIATATLHKEYGIDAVFSNQTIIEKIRQQKLCNVSYKTISDHISGHCVANAPTTSSSVHRKIYRVRPGIYRLYKRGESYHPTRERCKIAPVQFQLPDEYKDLRRWYDEEYCKK